MSRCSRCGQDKPADAFAVDRSKASGRKSWCKACDAAVHRVRYAAAVGRPVRRYRRRRGFAVDGPGAVGS